MSRSEERVKAVLSGLEGILIVDYQIHVKLLADDDFKTEKKPKKEFHSIIHN